MSTKLLGIVCIISTLIFNQVASACENDNQASKCANLIEQSHESKHNQTFYSARCPIRVDHYENRQALTIHLYKVDKVGFIFSVKTEDPQLCFDKGEAIDLTFSDRSEMQIRNFKQNCKGEIGDFFISKEEARSNLDILSTKRISSIQFSGYEQFQQTLSYAQSQELQETIKCLDDV